MATVGVKGLKTSYIILIGIKWILVVHTAVNGRRSVERWRLWRHRRSDRCSRRQWSCQLST